MSSRAYGKGRNKSQATSWSEWAWDGDSESWYRARLDDDGKWVYEFYAAEVAKETPIAAASSTTTYSTTTAYEGSQPRTNSTIEENPQESVAGGGDLGYTSYENYNASSSYGTTYPSTPVAGTVSNSAYTTQGSVDAITMDFGSLSVDGGAMAKLAEPEPKQFMEPVQHIRPSNPNTINEPEDPAIRVHLRRYFQTGQVFKLIWRDQRDVDNTILTEPVRSGSRRNGDVFVRYFVVVGAAAEHCEALPILVYTTQRPMPPDQEKNHAMIYTNRFPSSPRELGLRDSIRVVPKTTRDKLDPDSRLNFVKLYTVDYNVKVAFIGSVDQRDQQRLVSIYSEIQETLHNGPQATSPTPSTYISSSAYTAQNRQPSISNYATSTTSPSLAYQSYDYTSRYKKDTGKSKRSR